ncbi:MAG: zinc finger domain-containing protein [Candidatus Diapherotrites archaeon]|nr:zinc finger domain-containing protein [Candidatus Diapherotrites archaeon]
MKTCISCKKEITKEYVEFKCPSCNKHKIIRCLHCKKTSKEYSCPECGFSGP